MAYEVFISYSHQDQALRQKLDNHLANLKRQDIITSWYDGDITSGTEWQPQIMEHLNNAQIILLLISDDFMASDFCYSIEMTQAIARHDANQARVIPIILRPVDWKGAPFEKIQALPTAGKPVTNWSNYRVFEDDVSLAFLDKRPLFPGHCLLIPKDHYETLIDLPALLVAPLFQNAQLLARAIYNSSA